MWFFPLESGLKPSLEQKKVEKVDRTNRFLPLVSNEHEDALPIRSDAQVYSSFLQAGRTIEYPLKKGRGVYFYVLEGSPVELNDYVIPTLGAAKITDETKLRIKTDTDSELLLVDVLL